MYPNSTGQRGPAIDVTCVDKAPFADLLRSEMIGNRGGVLDRCLNKDVHNHDDLQRQIIDYMKLFFWSPEDNLDGKRITNAFTSAAFLANEAWLDSQESPSWMVAYDYGADA